MAGVNLEPAKESASRSLLGRRARAQYAALAGLRWHMLKNGLRTAGGVFELGARAFALLFIFGVMGLGLSILMGVTAYQLILRGQWIFLPLLFWAVFLLWQVVPILLASFQEQFDMSSLLRFPLSFRLFYLLYIVFGLTDISTILGGMCCIGLWVGTSLARSDLMLWSALSLGCFATFNILMARAVFAWIDRWLAQRKTREIMGAVFMLGFLGLQLLNPAFYQKKIVVPVNAEQRIARQQQLVEEYGPWVNRANAVQKWFPPGLAAVAPRRFAEQHTVTAVGSVGMLGVYALAAGGLLMVRLRAEYRGENLGSAPHRTDAPPKRKETVLAEDTWVLGGSGVIGAVMAKELHCLLRTLPQLYALGAPLLLVLILSGAGPSLSHPFILAFPVSLIYAQLGFTKIIYNNFGAEGAGLQMMFLSPTPIRTVLLGKNIFHATVYAIVLLIASVFAALRVGVPTGVVLAATVAWLLFALPSNLVAGNLFSLLVPYRVNPGRMTRQQGSRANALVSLLAQGAILAVGATVFGLCALFDRLWLAIPIFLGLALCAVSCLVWVLSLADGIANRRREALLTTLVKRD